MSDRVDLAVAIVYPLMKDYFKEWDPLKVSGQGRPPRSLSPGAARAPEGLEGEGPAGRAQPPCLPPQDCTYGTETISQWKSLLENDQLLSHGGQDLSADAFHRCFWGRRRSAPGRAAGLGRVGPRHVQVPLWKLRFAHLSVPGNDGGALPTGWRGSACVGPRHLRAPLWELRFAHPLTLPLCALRICLSLLGSPGSEAGPVSRKGQGGW